MAKQKQARHPEAPPRRTKRFLRRLGLLLLLAGGLLAAAPTLLSQTSLRDTLITNQLPNGWTLKSQQASLGWTSPQTLTGVTLTDPQGKPLLTIESLTLSKSLLSLATNQTDLGKIKLLRPVAFLETRPDGSNGEDFFAALQQPSPQQENPKTASTQKQIHAQLDVVDGAVRLFDTATQRQATLREANVSATLGKTTDISGSAQLLTDLRPQPGKIKFRWQPDADAHQHLELLADNLPLELLQPWITRQVPDAQLTGTLSTDAQLTWTLDPSRGLLLQTTGRLEVHQLDLTAPALAGDHLHTQQLIAPWKIQVTDNHLTLEQLTINTDWAKLQATGQLTLAELQSLNVANLPQGNAQLNGNVDLAQLAAMLPRTLQLRNGVKIDAGQLQFNFAPQPNTNANTNAWQATASIQNVAGTDGRHQIRWEQPIDLTAAWHATPTGPQLEQFTFTAPFAQAQIQTQPNAITGDFNLDLDQLSQELGQFVDLQAWQLRGLAEGTFTLASPTDQQFKTKAKIDLTDLRIVQSKKQLWTEPKLQVELTATGTQQELAPRTITTGEITLSGPRDAFTLQLLQPINLLVEKKSWDVQVEGDGPLASWANRLRPWLTSSLPKRLEGDAHLRAQLKIEPNAIHLKNSQGSVTQLRVESSSLTIDEPRVEFSGDAHWNRQTSSLVTHEMQLTGSSLSLRARDIAVALSGTTPTAQGNVAFRADLERLAAIAGLAGQSATTWPRGAVVGQIQLSSEAQQLQADFSAKAQPLEIVQTTTANAAANGATYGRPKILWTQPQLEATGLAVGFFAEQRAEIDQLKIIVGQGQLTVSPRLSWTPGAEQLVLPQGPLVSNVEITPEVSETFLKYAAPILAGTTRAEGQFSIDLDHAKIPLTAPQQANVQGRLEVHRLTVSPGPMVAQLATLVTQIKTLTKSKQFLQASTSPKNKAIVTVPESQIDFQVVQGRVYHRNLEFLIDGVPVRSRGSVGFDQTLAIEIEIPIQDEWIAREKSLRSFAGQSLRIPIYGTFQKPKIDQRAVADLSSKLLQGAATQVIGDELNRQFEKLFQ